MPAPPKLDAVGYAARVIREAARREGYRLTVAQARAVARILCVPEGGQS